jgi:eukaryotic-like serine/threonine-protein kinase
VRSREDSGRTVVGRYAIGGEIAAGGMATVHYGRLLGPVGFSRTVAIKRLHPQFAKDPEFVSMFLDEARLAARIRHPNVVSTLDVVALEGELFVVMDYVQGESLARLQRASRSRKEGVPLGHALAILTGVLHGLHAAHEATSERGEPLHIVHRDVSPQNVLVGVDGIPRVLDFGVAKAAGRVHTTREGQIKGKIAYMAPEQLHGQPVDRRTDVYAAAVVLWEVLAGRRLFETDQEAAAFQLAQRHDMAPPSRHAVDVPAELDAIVLRGLSPRPDDRFATAREMAVSLERIAPFPTARELGEWVEELAHASLEERAGRVADMESFSDVTRAPDPAPPTDPGTASTTSRDAAPPPHRPMLLGALATLTAVSMATALGLAFRSPSPDAVRRENDSSPAGSVQGLPGAAASGADTKAPVAASAPSAVVIAPPAASVPPAATAVLPGKKSSTPPVKTPPPRTAGASCDPPFTILPDGVRKYKPECLK